ncbi:MAG: mannitol dehydrogenase family protein, partial [Gammaproteobacteria bacterium]|nr:mannitol dehydrogenase family protein [Gammaproteobacteria bacterium]
MGLKLQLNSLDSLGDNVVTPGYDRRSLSPGILHIGVGNFHRAHQAVYLDKLFSLGLGQDWGLVGAGVTSYDARMRAALQAQDWLTTVIELDPEGYTARVCGAMIDFVEIDTRLLIERLATPDIRIVSLTITEGGYFIDEKTGGFNANHPDIVHDSENPDNPRTVFGVLVAGLAKRHQKNLPAFTVMSCDNLPGNGHIAQQAVVGMAKLISAAMSDWIEAEVSFPNGMVDCITPATGERERALVKEHFNIEDASPVVCEPFRQWVLEDKFSAGRPELEKVGVEFVDDVAPYELMKLRILNG